VRADRTYALRSDTGLQYTELYGSARRSDVSDDRLIDTHVHFWDKSVPGLQWSWLDAGFTFRHWSASASLDAPRFSVPEYTSEATGCNVAELVHGHSADPIDDPAVETAWLESVADRYAAPAAIVGKCSLAAADASAVLRRHLRHGRFRGVRDPDALRHLDADEISAAMEVCAEHALSVEVRRDHSQFEVLHEVSARWPQVTLALSHACLPLQRTAQQRGEWLAAMRELAVRPNVVVKISAVAGASDPQWTIDSIRPWILGCVETFGADRCMFGTNWPVDRQFGTLVALIDAYRAVIAELTPAERSAVLHRTAGRVYRLAP